MTDIQITKITNIDLLREAAGMTTGNQSRISLLSAYKSEHSPARTQMFWIVMTGIPTSSSVHLVRHKVWVEHFVKSNRPDRGGDVAANRETPINHGMFLNAQTLIEMAKLRLCNKASKQTREIMQDIVSVMKNVDPDLAKFLVPKCVYRHGLCGEFISCKQNTIVFSKYSDYFSLFD